MTSIAAAQRDYARRTPGVLGASNGGFGLTPTGQWGKIFPNRGALGTEGVGAAAPDATNLLPGDSGTNSLAPAPRLVAATPIPKGVPLTGNKATDDANQKALMAANLALAKNPTAPTGTQAGRAAPATDPNDYLNSAAVQGALNAANGNGKITPAANGGNVLASTYGDGSSHPGAPVDLQGPTLAGAPLGSESAVMTANGVQRVPDFQQQVVAAHPEIGVAGSEGNKAYVANYAKALNEKGAGNFDAVQLAHDTMSPIYNQRTAAAAQDTEGENEMARQAPGQMAASDAAAKQVAAGQAAKFADQHAGDAIEDTLTGFGVSPETAHANAHDWTVGPEGARLKDTPSITAPAAINSNQPGTGKAQAAAIAASGGFQPGVDPSKFNGIVADAAGQNSRQYATSNPTAPAGAAAGAMPYTFPTTPQVAQNGQPGSGAAQNTPTSSPRTNDEDEE